MAKTLTVEAPNVGGRPYYLCEDPMTSNRFKETPHVRLYTLDVLIINGADGWELHNFYRGYGDHDEAETQRQINAQRRKVVTH